METKTIEINKAFEMVLKGHGTTGYEWQWKVSPQKIVSVNLLKPVENGSENILPGSSVDEVYSIKGLKKGEATIYFYLVRAWEDDSIKPKEEKRIKVTVE